MKGNKGERRENEWKISVRGTEHERLLTLGMNKRWWKGRWAGGEGDWVMGTEGSTCLLYTSDAADDHCPV